MKTGNFGGDQSKCDAKKTRINNPSHTLLFSEKSENEKFNFSAHFHFEIHINLQNAEQLLDVKVKCFSRCNIDESLT